MRTWTARKFGFLVAPLLGGMALAPPTGAQRASAIPVATVAAELRPITRTTEFVGRVEAVEHVDIRARVTGRRG